MILAWDVTPSPSSRPIAAEILAFESSSPLLVTPSWPPRIALQLARRLDLRASRARSAPTLLARRGRAGLLDDHVNWCREGSFLCPSARSTQSARRSSRPHQSKYSKRDILTLYLNQIFLDTAPTASRAAARRYFEQAIRRVSTSARWHAPGSRRSPVALLSPLTSYRSGARSALSGAGRHGALVPAHRRRATAGARVPLPVPSSGRLLHTQSPYFTTRLLRDVMKRYGEKKLLRGGPADRDVPRPVDRISRPRRTSTSRARKLDKRQAALARRALRGRLPPRIPAPLARAYCGEPARRGAPLSRPPRRGRRRRRRREVALGSTSPPPAAASLPVGPGPNSNE